MFSVPLPIFSKPKPLAIPVIAPLCVATSVPSTSSCIAFEASRIVGALSTPSAKLITELAGPTVPMVLFEAPAAPVSPITSLPFTAMVPVSALLPNRLSVLPLATVISRSDAIAPPVLPNTALSPAIVVRVPVPDDSMVPVPVMPSAWPSDRS